MSDENVGGLVELPKPIRAMVRFTALQHIERDVYTAEQLHAYADARVEAALSAHGQPVDYSPALHSVLSYIAYGECDEEGLHPGLFATVKEKIDKLRSKPVVDEALRELIQAGKRFRNTVVETRGVRGMDEHDASIRRAEAVLAALTGADHE